MKKVTRRGWKNGLAVTGLALFKKTIELDSKHQHGDSQWSITLVPENELM